MFLNFLFVIFLFAYTLNGLKKSIKITFIIKLLLLLIFLTMSFFLTTNMLYILLLFYFLLSFLSKKGSFFATAYV